MQQGNFGSNNRYGSGLQQQQQGGGNFQVYGGMNPGGPPLGGQVNTGQQLAAQGIVWTPPSPQEKQYYDMLFQVADDEHTGSIGGRSAVMFFTKSGLDKSILREVWTIADSRQTSFLQLNDFYVAMRLIAMAQHGHPMTLTHFYALAASPFALARLEGVPPPQVQQQHQSPAPLATYSITSDEKTKYQTIFAQYDTDHDGFLLGQDAAALFQMSGMDRNDLRTIWALADRTSDGRLDLTEFYIAMHLIVCVTKRGMVLPQTLPLELEQSLRSTGSFSQSGSGHFSTIHQAMPQPPAPPQGMSAFDELESPVSAVPTEQPTSGFGQGDRSSGTFQHAPFASPGGPATTTGGLNASENGTQSRGSIAGGSFGNAADSSLRQSSCGNQPCLVGAGAMGQPSNFGSQHPSGIPPSSAFGSQRQASFGSPALDGCSKQAPQSNSIGAPAAPSATGKTISRQSSFGNSTPAAMDGFGKQATHTNSFGDFGVSSVPAPPLAPPPVSSFASNSRQASFGAQSSSSVSSAMDGFGKQAPHSNTFGAFTTTPQSNPSPLSAGLESSKGANSLCDFGSPLTTAVPPPSGVGSVTAPTSPGDFGNFGMAAPGAPATTGFGSTSGQQTGTVGAFGVNSPVLAPKSSSVVASGFGSTSHTRPDEFGDFSLPPAPLAVAPPPTSSFASMTPPSKSTDLAASTSQFQSKGPQQPVSGDNFGDFGHAAAPSTTATQPPVASGFGSVPNAAPSSSVSTAFDDFASPTNASEFGDFSGASTFSRSGGEFNAFGASTQEPSSVSSSFAQPSNDFGGFGISPPSTSSQVVAASVTFTSNKASSVPTPPAFGSTQPEAKVFGEFCATSATPASFSSNKITSGFDDFPSPTNSSGFGDFTSSFPPAPASDFGDFGSNPAPTSFGRNLAPSVSDFSLSSPAANAFAPISSTPSSSAPGDIAHRPSDVAGSSTAAPSLSSGFEDFPSPISTTTFEGFGSTKQTESPGFGRPSGGFGDFSAVPTAVALPSSNSEPLLDSPPENAAAATARELDAANASLLRSLTQLAVSQKNVVQVAHIQHLATNLLRLTAQRDQLRAAQSTDPSLALTIQRLIDDERAFISTTSQVLQELEQQQKQQKALSRQPSSSSSHSTGNSGYGAFEF
ncbi:hypothetical protein H310_04052 [Aphanomyces invadans]|uniref:Calmodulin n=1 Tax=Aphanomyces invadans TaxID=157072 RepID=A0A024UHA3_9STRA|nr:hypothetical protein H310_04052 [Aphanomyces invadans]ETW04978.1 hypothetical protein H310_04052 [Aphanomyces invadans]|eukprot:XP_008866416.1 hypothetical protein H310_04052 [Aphanomyces invadans]